MATVAFLAPLAEAGAAEAAGGAAAGGASAAGTTGGGFVGRVMSGLQFGGAKSPASAAGQQPSASSAPESEAQRA